MGEVGWLVYDIIFRPIVTINFDVPAIFNAWSHFRLYISINERGRPRISNMTIILSYILLKNPPCSTQLLISNLNVAIPPNQLLRSSFN